MFTPPEMIMYDLRCEEQVAVLVQVADIAQCGPARVFRVPGVSRLGVILVILEAIAAFEVDRPGSAGRDFVAVVIADMDRAIHPPADRPGLAQPLLGRNRRRAVTFGARVVL